MKIFELFQEVKEWLKEEGIIDYKIEAEIILSHVLNKDRLALHLDFNEKISPEDMLDIFEIVNRRIEDREPIQYIFNKTKFYGYSFKVDPSVLIPRKETELLVETCLEISKEFKKPKILDLGTGSGAIAVTLAKENKNGLITASDVSSEALKIAEYNANINAANVNFIESDLFSNINEKFDLIVSNPPYISEEEFEYLEPEIKEHEPKIALIASRNGLYFYEKISREAPKFLNPNSYLIFETGYSNFMDIKNILDKENYEVLKIIKDYNMQNRVIVARKR